jgi:hypothetical protein
VNLRIASRPSGLIRTAFPVANAPIEARRAEIRCQPDRVGGGHVVSGTSRLP